MSYRILFISSMYQGSLNAFYKSRSEDFKSLSYNEHCSLLLNTTTEFIGAYLRCFRLLGADADCVILNDDKLQKKWAEENGIGKLTGLDLLSHQINSFQPEILWIDDLKYVSRDFISDIKNSVKSIRLVTGYHCSPYGPGIIDSLKSLDIVITCTPGIKSDFEKHGARAYLVYHGFDNSQLPDSGPEPDLQYGLVFSGSLTSGGNFHDDRRELIEKILDEGIDISLFVNLEKSYKILAKKMLYLISRAAGKLNSERFSGVFRRYDYGGTMPEFYPLKLINACHPPVYGNDMLNLFSKSGVVLNMHIGMAGSYAGNMRLFEVTGMGSCLLTDNKKNIGDLFEPGKEIMVYDDIEDCINKARWLLENEDKRKEIALAGRNRTLKSHTVMQRCEQVLEILKKEIG